MTADLRTLALEFESLGDNCEFAFFQKAVGADQLGLLRWLGLSANHLVNCLQNQFREIDNPANLEFAPQSNGEYIVYIQKFDARGHTGVFADKQTLDQVRAGHARKLTFLKNKLLSDLRAGNKIFVYRQNEPILHDAKEAIFNAVSDYGPNTVLFVNEDKSVRIYSVQMQQDGLLLGFVRRLAPQDFVADFSYTSWFHLCHAVIKLQTSDGDGNHRFRSTRNPSLADPSLRNFLGQSGT